MSRPVTHRYRDPLDQVWLRTAEKVGFRVDRSADVYAHSDGKRRISIGSAEILDADDSLAQMIFHELCHGMLEGVESFDKPDWGLENADDRHEWREHACLRLQAELTRRHGLRKFLAPTTDFRAYYDALPEDPMTGGESDATVEAAKVGLERFQAAPFHPHVQTALEATAAIAHAAAHFSETDEPDLPSIYGLLER